MRLRLLAVLGLIVVGLGAIGLALFAPAIGGSDGTRYLTSTASRGTVSAQSVATGTIAASATYGLSFGAQPELVTDTSQTSSASASSGGGSTSSWPVSSVAVAVGDQVTKGQELAVADDAAARLAVTAAEAKLAAARARLATDRKGPDAATKASAADSVTNAKLQLQQAVSSRTYTRRQNALSVSQARSALARAEKKYADDKAAGQPETVLHADRLARASARESLASTEVRAASSNASADAQVRSAQQAVTSAKHGYTTKVAPATEDTILTDQAAVATAEAELRSAQDALAAAHLLAPADGTVVAVNVVPGFLAPSGHAVEIQSTAMEVTASFTETDIGKLKLGQPARITVAAASATVDGTVALITPTGSGSGGSAVVTYAVSIQLKDPPASVLAGMTASVAVTTAEAADVVTVPAVALVGSSGSYSVRVIGADGQSSLVPVEVGLVANSAAEIKSGLTEGETVAVGTISDRNQTTTAGGAGGAIPGITGGGGRIPGGGFVP